MSFIDRDNNTIANKTLPLKVFTSAADYARWRDSLVDPATEIPRYNILRDYPQDFSITADNRSSASLGEDYMILSKANMPPEPVRPYFTITSDAPMSTYPRFNPNSRMSYSVDNGYSWTGISPGYGTKASTVTKFRGHMPNNSLYDGWEAIPWSTSGGTMFDLSGHLSTLLREDGNTNIAGYRAFNNMFNGQGNLRHLKDLVFPSSIGERGAFKMFYNCINVYDPPTMPNSEVGVSAFESAFQGCTNLRSFPKLPAQTLSPSCYTSMFRGDYSASGSAPKLPSYPLVKENCYWAMFRGCTRISQVYPLNFGDISCADYMFCDVPYALFNSYPEGQYQSLTTTEIVQYFFIDNSINLVYGHPLYGAFYH